MKKTHILVLSIAAIALPACTTTKGITPQYINPNTYASHSCQSLESEVTRISKLATDTEQQQTPLSATGIGIGITAGRGGIYPSISLGIGKGTGNQKKATLSKLYGEHDAMILAARQKNCNFANGIKIYGETD